MLRSCTHANIVQVLDAFEVGQGVGLAVWIVMELCDAGSAEELLSRLGSPIGEAPIAYVCSASLHALAFLHSRNISVLPPLDLWTPPHGLLLWVLPGSPRGVLGLRPATALIRLRPATALIRLRPATALIRGCLHAHLFTPPVDVRHCIANVVNALTSQYTAT